MIYLYLIICRSFNGDIGSSNCIALNAGISVKNGEGREKERLQA
jgi:hypothetical protein